MTTLAASDLVLNLGGLAFLAFAVVFGLPRVWRGEAWQPHDGESPYQAAWVRCLPIGALAFAWLIGGSLLSDVLGLDEPTPDAFFIPYSVGLAAVGVIAASIALFNAPKALVAPPRRHERGMLQGLRSR